MQLERLRKKSLLDSISDGTRKSIMHDLWYEFCIAETKYGELRGRQWVYERKTLSEGSPCGTIPSGNCWENVKRMAFLDFTSRSLERVNFAHFPNVRLLMIRMHQLEKKLVVELSGLTYLRSLVFEGSGLHLISIQGLPRYLVFLRMVFPYFNKDRWVGDESISLDHIGEQIGGLEELQCLQFFYYRGGKLPDMRHMVSLREVVFYDCSKVVMESGLGLNLRVLKISWCKGLRSCPSVGELVVLEELDLCGCDELESLPNLGRLRKLRMLNINYCQWITELPGLGDLVALELLSAKDCTGLMKLPNMRKLANLRVLELGNCSSITEVPGLEGLASLQELTADFRAVVDKPNLRLLTKLQQMRIKGWSSREIQELSNLTMLETLDICCCSGVDEMSDFHNLSRLEYLSISDCEFKDVSSLSTLCSLRTLIICHCSRLERLPEFQRLPSLLFLRVEDCVGLRGWDCTSAQDVEGRSCRLEDTSLTLDVPNAQMVVNLKILILKNCGIANLTSIGTWSQLERLEIAFLPLTELPDLSCFPQLESLWLRGCENLVQLTSREPLIALSKLEIDGCSSLATLPDICNYFKGLLDLKLKKCDKIVVSMLRNSGPMTALTKLEVELYNTWTTGPDLGMFPRLRDLCLTGWSELHGLSSATGLTKLEICNSGVSTLPDLSNFSGLVELILMCCDEITTICCTGPLTTLTTLKVECCNSLRAVPDLGMFPSLDFVFLDGCSELAALSSSVPLTRMQWLSVRGCRSLSRDDLEKLRALCPQEKFTCKDDGIRHEDYRYEDQYAKLSWRVPLLGLCGAIVVIGIMSFTW
jgi:Leucine-rich repeat (LRR) protein